jgi:very-short-patch-repair endonuclease
MRLRYAPPLKQRARELRSKSTLAEVLLWQHLKGRQRHDYDFHRQRPVDCHILDFFAPKLMPAVEIDGETHRFKADEDRERQRRLESSGIRFLRFGDLVVKKNVLGVAIEIDAWIEARAPSPTHHGAPRHPFF